MKKIRLLPFIAIFIAGCKGCNDQSDRAETIDTISRNKIDTTVAKPDTPVMAPEQPKKETTSTTGQSRAPEIPRKDPGILASIDKYLISTPKYSSGANGGIMGATISVRNTLSTASFQKVIIEVTVVGANNQTVSQDYYTVVNIDPGTSKQFTIPDSPQGSKLVIHVVKVKSNELTNGESVVTGVHYNQ